MVLQFFDAQGDQVAGEHFRQRRGYRFYQRPAANDIQVFVDGEAGGRKDSASRANLRGVEAGRFRQFQPTLNSTLTRAVAVVINDPLSPGAAKFRVGPARKNDRVFDRNDALVVIAVQGPGLQLPGSETSLMHPQVERVLMVIALRANRLQPRRKFAGSQNSSVICRKLNSHRSSAT